MIYEAVPFIQTGTLRSNVSTYPGVPVGITQPVGFKQFVPELGVANFGSKPANIKVLYTSAGLSSGTPQEIASVSVSPLTSTAIPIPDLPGDPNMQNSFLVQTDAEKGQVISTLHARSTDGEQILDLPNQDQKKLANGGQHPWVIDKSTASYLLLYNADASSPRNVAVTLYTGTNGGRISKTVQVDPAHTIALSVQDLLTETEGAKTSDTASNPEPAQVQSQQGIVTWLSLDASTIFGRMLQVNNLQRWSRNFSCQVEYIACAATAFPNTTLLAGESNTLYGYANVCPSSGACTCDGSGSCTFQTAPASSYYWWVDDTSIASLSGSIYGSSVTVLPGSPGQTNVELSVADTSDYQCSASTEWAYGQPAQITVQKPTASRITATTQNNALSSGQSPCDPGYAGWIRVVTKIVTDQNGGDIVRGGQNLTEQVSIGSPNDLNITGQQTGAHSTNSNGLFSDTLFVCSSLCPQSGGQTVATQTISDAYLGYTYTLQSNTFTYTCNGIQINGQ